jgi:diacylglycerol kinase (ATP)
MHKKSQKKHGISHLFATLKYSFQGLLVLSQETAFKHEVLLLLCGYGIFFVKYVALFHYIILTILWFILIGFEALNTAIELIIDHISPQYSDFAKRTKDLGSFSVSVLITSFIAYCLYIIFLF